MFEAGLLVKAGTVPRPLGVPLMVPLEAIVGKGEGRLYVVSRLT